MRGSSARARQKDPSLRPPGLQRFLRFDWEGGGPARTAKKLLQEPAGRPTETAAELEGEIVHHYSTSNDVQALLMGGVGSGKTAMRRQRHAEGYVHIDASEIFALLGGGDSEFPGPFERELWEVKQSEGWMSQDVKRRKRRAAQPSNASRSPEGRRATHWAWKEGAVDPTEEHFELRYGSADDSDWAAWPLIARVGPPTRGVFPVQFIAARETPTASAMVEAVEHELSFYLVGLGERDPWLYAKYHSGTSSNLYSRVHWVYCPKERSGTPE
jgi:hypothetical protein